MFSMKFPVWTGSLPTLQGSKGQQLEICPYSLLIYGSNGWPQGLFSVDAGHGMACSREDGNVSNCVVIPHDECASSQPCFEHTQQPFDFGGVSAAVAAADWATWIKSKILCLLQPAGWLYVITDIQFKCRCYNTLGPAAFKI